MQFGEGFDSALEAARAGEEWAWAALFRFLSGPVTGYLRMHGAADPEDLASETFLQVARGIHTFEGGEDEFRSWVFVIAHRRLIDSRRKAGRLPKVAFWTAEDADLDRLKGGDVVDDALGGLSSEAVEEALARLTRDQREVIMLRVIADLSVADTAKVMGKSEGAVRVLQHRAIEILRKRLGGGA